MALQDILLVSQKDITKKQGLSEERLHAQLNNLRTMISFYREYPDLFVDFLQDGGDPTIKKELKFFFYQRVKK